LHGSLCAIAAANATTLQELCISVPGAGDAHGCRPPAILALLGAAPLLHTLEADVLCANAADAHRVLRNEPPFGPLRVRHLSVRARAATADAFLALAADLAAHAWLASVWLLCMPLDAPGAMDALVDAALARRLSYVRLGNCNLSPASAPALARLLRGDSLAKLNISGANMQLLDEPAATLLANALRANTSLTALTLVHMRLWRDAAAAAVLMGALTAHPRLRLLDLSANDPNDGGLPAEEAGAALGALLLANTPALQTLHISWCGLGDEAMGPVVEALRHNTHLTKLDCSSNDMSAAFARDELLPAVRANTSLRELVAAEEEEEDEEGWDVAEREAEALVAARAQPQ
jgi:hypothetical protein